MNCLGCTHIKGKYQAVSGCVSRGSTQKKVWQTTDPLSTAFHAPWHFQLSSEKKARKRSQGVGGWADPAPRKVGRAARRICNPQEQELEALKGPLGLRLGRNFIS